MPKKTQYETYHLHAKRDLKHKDALKRQAAYNALTLEEKFATLIPGGSNRQRAKLQKQLDVVVSVIPAAKPTKPPVKSLSKKK
jgi:hypothetical protein